MKLLRDMREAIGVLRRFVPELREHRRSLGFVGAASLGSVVLELARPWPIQWIFDYALMPDGGQAIDPTRIAVLGGLALLGLVLSRVALDYFRNVRIAIVGHAVTRSLRLKIFRHLVHLSPTFHARHKSGDLLVRLMGDVPMVRTMLVDSTMEIATRSVLIVGTVVVMLSVDALLTAILIVLVPLFAIVVAWIGQRITIAVRKQRRKEGELADFLHEAISGAETIQSLGRSEHAVHRFARSNRRNARAGLKATRLGARLSASVESMLALAVALTLILGTLRVISGHLKPGELLVFISYVRGLLKPVRSASRHSERFAKGTACGERILSVLDEPIAVVSPEDSLPVPARIEELRFVDVSYRYGEEAWALREVDIAFRVGQLTGVVGRSGAGKSTLASLSLRLFDATCGSVCLDGTDVKKFDLAGLRDRFGLCMQESVLFGESVRENLALGKLDADDDEMWSALEDAGADELVRDLPAGLDTVLGTGGKGFSGGERRRVVLARTFLRGAAIVIADEPFTGLDQARAERVRRSLKKRAKSSIVVVIAHEREYLGMYDRIVLLDGGQVIAQGTHESLSRDDSTYRSVIGAGEGVEARA